MQPTSTTRTIAIVGCGPEGLRWARHLRAADPALRLHCFDPDAEQRAALAVAIGATAHDALASLLAARPDGAVVATGPAAGGDAALRILLGMRRGDVLRKLMLGSQLATDLGTAQRIVNLAQAFGVELSHPFHQVSWLQPAIAGMANGLIGEMRTIRCTWESLDREDRFDEIVSHALALVLALHRGEATPMREGLPRITVTQDERRLVARLEGSLAATIGIGRSEVALETARLEVAGTAGGLEAHLPTGFVDDREADETGDPERLEPTRVRIWDSAGVAGERRAAEARGLPTRGGRSSTWLRMHTPPRLARAQLASAWIASFEDGSVPQFTASELLTLRALLEAARNSRRNGGTKEPAVWMP